MPTTTATLDWSRLPADLLGDGTASGARVAQVVRLPHRVSEVVEGLAARHDLTKDALQLALQLGVVSRYVGPTPCVQFRTNAGVTTGCVALEEGDDLVRVAQRVSTLLQDHPPDADAGADAPIRLAVGDAFDAADGNPLDLAIRLVDHPDAPQWELLTDARFTEATFAAVARTATTWCTAIADDPALAFAFAPVLDDATRSLVLETWNATQIPRRADELAHHALERLAARAPHHVVAELGARTLTARELDARANALADRLASLGVTADVAVGVALERSFELLVALFAVLKAGGAFVAVDPELPLDRQAWLLNDANAHVLLTQPHLLDTLRPSAAMADATLLTLATTDAHTPVPTAKARPRGTKPTQPAYIVYTSGSTGRPKGVRVPHRALVNHAAWFAEATQLTPTDRVLHYASVSFDAALAELFAPIAAGARIVLAPPHAHRDLLGLFDRAQASRISVLQAVPSVLRAALDAGALRNAGTLRYLVSGGEALDHALVRRVREQLPHVRIGNFYGPSEACVDSTMIEVSDELLARRTIPIGRPIANARCHVLDRFLQPVPIGALGELYIGGRGLAIDYMGQSELTGRVDTQVKVRGFRLELAEIETALRGHPGVRECAVVAPADAHGERTLVAWIAVAPGASPPSARAIIARLRQTLPDYAIPSHIGVLDALPLNPSGKLNRPHLESLPLPAPAATRDDTPREAVTDPIARRLVPIWEEVLGVSPIGLDDAFFDLGGHSLKAIRLLNQIEREFGLDVHAGVLFEAPTVRQLAARLQERSARLASTIIPVQPNGTRPPVFFVPGGGGELFVFEALAQALGRDQPLHVIDLYAFGDRADLPPEPSLEQIVRVLVNDLQRVQPTGPYHLAGYSMGGMIALEMARQLSERGAVLGTLLMLDADGPDYPRLQPLPQRLLTHARHALSLGPRGMLRYLRERLPRAAVRLGLRPAEPHRLYAQEEELDLVPPDVIAGMERAIAPLVHAWERYRPAPYAGPVLLLRAEIRQLMVGVSDSDPRLGWGPVLPNLRVTSMACTHFDMLRAPNAPRVAAVVRSCLSEAH
ncbi:MAG: AMP-binding protein [Gemmatimonadaceae bacterium]|nr:AMP-binding protein [Gemmatimonadaceae bacterium]